MKRTPNISGTDLVLPRSGGQPRRRAGTARLFTALLTTGLLSAAVVQGQAKRPESTGGKPSPILASYDFEDPRAAGPDTFRIYEHTRGRVDLSASFRVSGSRSLRIHEEPENGCFSEFLGFFEKRTSGAIFVQFYLLLTDPGEIMNFALAGPRWFLNFERGGHAVWLQVKDGVLRHLTGSEWRDVLAPDAFTWYFIDLVYDVDRGEYDLAIFREGLEQPLVDLHRQRNAADADRSEVAYYSLIGDLEDKGRVTYFADDLLIASDPAVRLEPFVAPGRRTFFVELFNPERKALTAHQREDLLFDARSFLRRRGDLEAFIEQDLADRLERAADEAFFARDLELAEKLYSALERAAPDRARRALLKLSDVYFLLGDLEAEKSARETIYGRLDYEELRDAEER